MLEKLGKWVRENLPWFAALERKVWGLPQPWSGVLSALWHGIVTAASLVGAPVVAYLYTERELRWWGAHRSPNIPLWDSITDIVVPWSIVALYAAVFGWFLRGWLGC